MNEIEERGIKECVDEALDIAKQAAERFPLLPRVWHDLGRIP